MKAGLLFAVFSGVIAAPAALEHQTAQVSSRHDLSHISEQTLHNIRKECPKCTITPTHVDRSVLGLQFCHEIDACCSVKAPINCYDEDKFKSSDKFTSNRDVETSMKIQKRTQCDPCCTGKEDAIERWFAEWLKCKHIPVQCDSCDGPPEWEWIVPGGVNDQERHKGSWKRPGY
ncbi:hypothetical protein BDP81DRAFT_517337 [Colletotrichum phormii]|uniref:Uncharacterized protein n=1 Tax=Colletotrichum phormii TaxID=359342 RepID=A0AAJ0EG44_9PEZI|nr:uncharacterized protein BDP81DRAFT_517337 [Colletotrichum phormii]KAK1637718.1 hypothetical protein BDP81DRAFT_517337 [Colletotrichum phormii]